MAKASSDKAAKPREYTVLTGINYPPNDTRARPGDVVTLTDPVADALLRAGAVEALEVTKAREAEAAALAAQQAAQARQGGAQ